MPKDVKGVMHEFKHGELHSGSSTGPKVTNRKQAIAIALSEQRQLGKGPKKKTKHVDGSSGTPPGAVSHKPRVFHNPKTLSGRRTASHQAAYGD